MEIKLELLIFNFLRSSKKDRKKSSDRRGVSRRRHSEDGSSNNKTLVISTSSAKKASSVMSSSMSSRKNLTSQQQQQQQQPHTASQTLLNKSERQTLERMHTATLTSTSGLNGSGCYSPTRSTTTTNGDAECFNNRSMTKLAAENLDNKRLHESRISSKIFKPVTTNGVSVNGNGSPTSVPPTTLTGSNGINGGVEASNIDFSNEDVDWDESAIRNLIGEDSMNDIDRYFGNLFEFVDSIKWKLIY